MDDLDEYWKETWWGISHSGSHNVVSLTLPLSQIQSRGLEGG